MLWWCRSVDGADLRSRHRDADLLLTASLYIRGHNFVGCSAESICSFSAPFLLASSVNHQRRYINDFKTRWDTIKRNYARFLSHASFNGLADFAWAQQLLPSFRCAVSPGHVHPARGGLFVCVCVCVCVFVCVCTSILYSRETSLMCVCTNIRAGYVNLSVWGLNGWGGCCELLLNFRSQRLSPPDCFGESSIYISGYSWPLYPEINTDLLC